MNRREFAAVIGIGGIAFGVTVPDEWITVASKGKNQAGRIYDDFAMERVAHDVRPGMLLLDWRESVELEEGDISRALGVISESRHLDDKVQVKIKWIGDRKPQEQSWATLNGTAVLRGDNTFESIKINYLAVTTGGSTFAAATPV